MKSLRSFGAAFALVVLGFLAHAATVGVPPEPGFRPIDGSWLIGLSSGQNFTTQTGIVTGASGQANCTAIGANNMNAVTSSVSSGSICLPPAGSGRQIYIQNATGNSIQVFGSLTPAVSGGDTLNGTAGSTGLAVTAGQNIDCFTATTGAWACTRGS